MEALHKINPDIPTFAAVYWKLGVWDSTDNCYFNNWDLRKDRALFKQEYPVETIEAGIECSSDEDDEAPDEKEVTWYQREENRNSMG